MSAQLAILEMSALIRSGASAKEATKQFRIDDLSKYQQKQFRLIWDVAQESGGTLSLALDRLAQILEQQQRQLSELKLAFSSPRATANLILILPLITLFASELIGIGSLAIALANALGVISLSVGLILLILARVISLKMLSRARPFEDDPGSFLDAVVIALSAGLAPKAAQLLVERIHLEVFEAPVSKSLVMELESATRVSEQSGIALTGILLARADSLRHAKWNLQRERISKLSVSLMIPLGLIALPAFVLLAVVPLGLGLFATN